MKTYIVKGTERIFNNNYGITAHLYQIEGIDHPSLSRSRLLMTLRAYYCAIST